MLVIALCLISGGQAQSVFSWSSDYPVNIFVPGNGDSWQDTQTLTGLPGIILGVEVRLNLVEDYDEGNNGDLYAYLFHNGQLVVLLNRVGRCSGNENGYLDSGFDITLADSAISDVHWYGGNNGNLVTGLYQPDGRIIDPTSPAAIFDTAQRQNGGFPLSLFNGMDPNGDWTLCISDHGPVGTSVVRSWGMSLNLALVPEPMQATLAMGLVSFLAGLLMMRARRSRQRAGPS